MHRSTLVFSRRGHLRLRPYPKPFEEVRNFQAYLGDGVPVYNTGGWVVETVDPGPLHGGAAVLLNENLDVASLRLL